MPEHTFRIKDLAPPSWFRAERGSSIWLRGYRVLRVPKEALATGPRVTDLSETRAIVLYGTLNYVDTSDAKIEIIAADQWRFDTSRIRQRSTPEGSYLLIMAPHDTNGIPGNEPLTRERIARAAGLFAVFEGRNVVYERLFDNVVDLETGNTTGFSSVLDSPLWFPPPNLQMDRLNAILAADQAISLMQEADRNRVWLSLRWFEAGLYDSGVDAFLKHWIALETLAMPDTTNVRPVNEILARAYGSSLQEAHNRSAVGRLFGLRSRIVHEGQIVPIHARLLDYVAAVYVDALLQSLDLPTERKAESVRTLTEFELARYLHEK